MSQRRKLNVKLNGNDDKEKFQRETVRLLEQFFQLDIDEQVRFHSGDQENVSSQKPGGNLQKGAGVLTEDTDDIPQVFEDPRTELEQEIVHELRRIADDIDRNGNFTKTYIKAAGTVGLNATRIKENCLNYVEDKCADWIVKHGGWASMLSDDSDDSTPEVD
ncbi:uncharacterized protein LOC127850841 [Dreissena polymorpha]|uniref:uncharacterized protein LOC127850841 n=1 Tax=Dreissena polymorpha TaxID=45954 RepID=UPI002265133E|nr:uncharacterized protein LOC127850841 [Dreissena polymorpha]